VRYNNSFKKDPRPKFQDPNCKTWFQESGPASHLRLEFGLWYLGLNESGSLSFLQYE